MGEECKRSQQDEEKGMNKREEERALGKEEARVKKRNE